MIAIHLLFTICLSLCTSLSAIAQISTQGKVLQGIVKDANGNGLPGVNVVIKGTTKGAVTNLAGKYTLAVDFVDLDRAVLVFSFTGFISQELPVDNRTNINVVLLI